MVVRTYLFAFCLIFVVCGFASSAGTADTANQCLIETVNLNIASSVDQKVSDGAKVIYIDFELANYTGSVLENDISFVYNPLSWVRTTGRHGRSLLLLRPQYQMFSLQSLNLGTEEIRMALKEHPSNCLSSNNATVVTRTFRDFLLYNFKLPEINNTSEVKPLDENEHVCNLNIRPKNGKAEFYYMCCYKTSSGQTKCQQLQSDKYIIILFVCIYIVNFFAVMFSPLLIPAKFYRKKFETISYEHHLKEPLTMSVRKTSIKPKSGDNVFPLSSFEDMPHFMQKIGEIHSEVTCDVKISKIDIVTENKKLLPSNNVPVGLLESLYSALVQCEVRKKPSITDCCESNLCGSCRPCNFSLPWYKCLKILMQVLLYILLGFFWILRIYFFYKYEESERLQREVAASKLNLDLQYTGNLTWFFTPLHNVFIACYCIFVIDVILFGVLSRAVKMTLKQVMRRCLRDMREISKQSAFGWSVQILLQPFKHCGVFGIFFVWLYYIPAIPVVVCTLAFYCLPTVNLIVRLIMYFIAYLRPYGRNCLTVKCFKALSNCWRYIHKVFRIDIITKQESIERPIQISVRNRFLQLIVILACLLTILSFVTLAMECIVFLVEIFMYTLIGIIVNATHTLKYISLVFLLGFYARDCFSTVTQEYSSFNKFLNGYLVDKMRAKVEQISSLNHELQRNTAFQVSLEDKTGSDDKPVSLMLKGDIIKWKVKRLILFLDKNDTPYITSKFFFDTCYLEQAGVPGPLISSLLRAMQRFLLICIFLFFVVIVILAFGEEYGISATNQMFATLAGGFLPYILRFVLFKQPEPVTVDPNNLSFKSKFERKIEEYSQNWKVADIRIDSITERSGPDAETPREDAVIEDETTSTKDKAIMLDEITPIVKDKPCEHIDIIIYDKHTV